MNRMNYLAQLALMLQGSGMGNQYGPDDPYAPGSNDGSGGYGSVPGSHLPVTPVQEFMLGTSPFEVLGGRTGAIPRPMPFPFPGSWSDPIPRWSPFTPPRVIPGQPRFPIPYDVPIPPLFPIPRKRRRDDMLGEPDDGTTETPMFPPYNPPFPIPDAAPGGGANLPPITIPNLPYNPPFEIPDDVLDDGLSEYGKLPKMTKRCKEEWIWARKECQAKKLKYYESGNFGKPFDEERCVKGYVSVPCGGTPLDWGPKGKPYQPPEDPDPSGFIEA